MSSFLGTAPRGTCWATQCSASTLCKRCRWDFATLTAKSSRVITDQVVSENSGVRNSLSRFLNKGAYTRGLNWSSSKMFRAEYILLFHWFSVLPVRCNDTRTSNPTDFFPSVHIIPLKICEMQLFPRWQKTYYNCLEGFQALEYRTPIGQWMHSFRTIQFLVWDRWYEPQDRCFFLWIGQHRDAINKCCRNMNAIKDGRSAFHDDSTDVLGRQAL